MKLTKTVGVVLAVLLVASAGAAALPGNAPVDAQNETDDAQMPEDAGAEMNDSDAGPPSQADDRAQAGDDNDDRRGPPVDMPEQVPDFVSQIHELIHQHMDEPVDNLGEQISDLTPGEESDEDAEDSDAEESNDEADDEDADSDDAEEEDEEMDDEDADDESADA